MMPDELDIPDGAIITGVYDNGSILGVRWNDGEDWQPSSHAQVIAMLMRRVDALEAECRQMRKTVQDWTGE